MWKWLSFLLLICTTLTCLTVAIRRATVLFFANSIVVESITVIFVGGLCQSFDALNLVLLNSSILIKWRPIAAGAWVPTGTKILLFVYFNTVMYFINLALLLLQYVLIKFIHVFQSQIVGSVSLLLLILTLVSVEFDIRYQGDLLGVTQVIDVLHHLVVIYQIVFLL